MRIWTGLVKPIPEYGGFMKLITRYNNHPAVHKVDFLPFVDMDPDNESTIYTTIKFVMDMCEKNGVRMVVLTFDQAVWWKAMAVKLPQNDG